MLAPLGLGEHPLRLDLSVSEVGSDEAALASRSILLPHANGRQLSREMRLVVPEVVRVPQNETEFYGLQYAELVPLLIKAIQEQQAIIEDQRSELETVSERVVALEALATN